jgi:hypothetical protein
MKPNDERDGSRQLDAGQASVDVSDELYLTEDEQARFEAWLKDFDARHAVFRTQLDAFSLSLGSVGK